MKSTIEHVKKRTIYLTVFSHLNIQAI